jgi:poly-beta-1,6-N-acetyl-D-glucosamine synthase
MMFALQLLFWSGVFGVAYIFFGYPLLVWFHARSPQKIVKSSVRRSLSIVIVAHNEAKSLPKKLTSLLLCEKAEWIEEILIGSDGSTDDTMSAVQAHADPRVRIIAFPSRRGKPAGLNDLVPQCRGEFVLFADARQEFDRHCLERLLENFEDETIGVVSGELVLRAQADETAAAQGIGFYWKYEKFIRKCESAYRGVPGATGACYVIRKSLFRPIPEQTILDDVAIPMQAVIAGYRCVFEPAAIIFDVPSQSPQQESVRKRRTIAGVAQLVKLFPDWIWPANNPLWLEFISHKLLRLISPLLLIAILATNLALLSYPFYQLIFALQLVFYAAALIGWICQRTGRKARLFGPPLMFLTLNITTFLALWDVARSRYRVTWQK